MSAWLIQHIYVLMAWLVRLGFLGAVCLATKTKDFRY
jgi:hypothetical protein